MSQHNYTLVAWFSATTVCGYGIEWFLEEELGEIRRKYDYVYKLKHSRCISVGETIKKLWEVVGSGHCFVYRYSDPEKHYETLGKLWRVMRDRYPDYYSKLEVARDSSAWDRCYSRSQEYKNKHHIAYFFSDGRWGIEHCEDSRVECLRRKGAKIYSWDNTASSLRRRSFRTLDEQWGVEARLFNVMRRRYKIEPLCPLGSKPR